MTVRGVDPFLDDGVRGFIRKTALKEYWKMASWMNLEDLIQDGYFVYYKCRNKFRVPERHEREAKYHSQDRDLTLKEQKRLFMAFFSRAFYNHITTLANKRMGVENSDHASIEVSISQLTPTGEEGDGDPWNSIAAAHQPADASLSILLRTLPAEIQQLITILAGDGAEALGMLCSRLERKTLPDGSIRVVRHRRRRRETTNEYYCRLLGLDPRNHDVAGQVRALFKST